MPRTFPSLVQEKLNEQFAGEPMVIVEVAWDGDNFMAYTDRKLNDAESPQPKIIAVGSFDTTVIVSGGSDSQSVNVVMDDTDASIRGIIDRTDVHLKPVRLYLTFQGVPFSQKALMFEGVINSPIIWNEADRTLSFTVLSKLEDAEAGFTMEDGDFPYVPPSERNKPWPLVFGEVCNMEAVRVSALRKGYLAQGLGVPDPTIDERLCQAYHLKCPIIYTPVESTTSSRGFALNPGQGPTAEEVRECNEAWAALGIDTTNLGTGGEYYNLCGGSVLVMPSVRTGRPDPQCVERKQDEICTILQEKQQQEQYVVNPFIVRGGEDFPQGEQITIRIGDVRYTGVMTGESFQVHGTRHPAEDTIDNPPCTETPVAGRGWRDDPDYDNPPLNIAECESGNTEYVEDIRNGAAVSWEYYESFEKGDFIWLPPGSEVLLDSESDLVHIVSLIPGVVNQVAAYRTYGDTSLLTELSTDYYTVHLENYGGYQTAEIWLEKPLSQIEDEDWDDEIYVSFTSNTGPGPMSTIQWLIEKYTDYTIDATSFAAVGTSLTNYPANFFVKARPRVWDLVRDIAYQSRCAIFIRDNVVYATYLATEPTSLRTLTEDDILVGTFSFSHTPTESLETKHEISWSEGEAGVNKDDETDFSFVLKHNVPKYGIFDASYDYYTYNIFELVEKSATFWMIRKSNTWRYVEFETPVKHLDLDVFDCVTLDIAQFPTTKIVIEETEYNVDNNSIRFKAWTPIRSGETSEYMWAWPSQQAAAGVFPLPTDAAQESGDGTGITVIPPVDHPLRGGYDADSPYVATDGDTRPSDLDDSLPTLTCKLATGSEIADDVEPAIIIQEPLAEKNFQDKLNSLEVGGIDVTSNDDKESKGACGKPGWQQLSCEYEVRVMYVNPSTVTTVQPPDGNCKSGGTCKSASNNGRPCTGALWVMCHSFGALFAARFFSESKKAEAKQLWDTCGYSTGVVAVYQASDPIAIPCDDCVFGDCEDPSGGNPGDPNAPGADAGETKKAQCTGDPDEDDDPGPNNCPGTDDGDGKSGAYDT